MDSLRRQRSNTDAGYDQNSNKGHHGSRGSFSKETKSNNRISLPPGFYPNSSFVVFFCLLKIVSASPPPMNAATGKSWMKLFGNQQLKK